MSQLWLRFDPWPPNFHTPLAQPKEKKRGKKGVLCEKDRVCSGQCECLAGLVLIPFGDDDGTTSDSSLQFPSMTSEGQAGHGSALKAQLSVELRVKCMQPPSRYCKWKPQYNTSIDGLDNGPVCFPVPPNHGHPTCQSFLMEDASPSPRSSLCRPTTAGDAKHNGTPTRMPWPQHPPGDSQIMRG